MPKDSDGLFKNASEAAAPKQTTSYLVQEIMDNVYDPHTPRQPAYFSFFGLVGHIKNDDKTYYLACPEDSCRKKVIEENNNEFKCESCGKIYPTCVPTYKLLVKMNDLSDSLYVNFYRNEGTAVMRGVDA